MSATICECGRKVLYFSKKKKKFRADHEHHLCEDCWQAQFRKGKKPQPGTPITKLIAPIEAVRPTEEENHNLRVLRAVIDVLNRLYP